MNPVILQDVPSILAAWQADGIVCDGLGTDSRTIVPGMAFAAYPGERSDGRDHLGEAAARQAAALLWEAGDGWHGELPAAPPAYAVRGLRPLVSALAGAVYGEPSRVLRVIGVTGTNGKTSSAHWLAQALERLGNRTAVMGTLGNGFMPALDASVNTTADAAVVQQSLAHYLQEGARQVVMEVSSIGLAQHRVEAVRFDTALLTNLSRDHLDAHGDMAAYAAAKARLFSWPGLRCAVLNTGDAFGAALLREGAVRAEQILRYGSAEADVRAGRLELSPGGVTVPVETPWGSARLSAPVLGRFNAQNLLGVLAVLLGQGIGLPQAVDALSGVRSPAGRMQAMGGGERPLVVIDYAHTPDALEKVLETLRETAPQGRLVCVFGCGGDRDRGKRPLMGEIAARLADQVIVTSDNPRSEGPLQIITEIRAGMDGRERVVPDRAQAIAEAVRGARPGDIVLIAGKGHEQYQEADGRREPFSDAGQARQQLEVWS